MATICDVPGCGRISVCKIGLDGNTIGDVCAEHEAKFDAAARAFFEADGPVVVPAPPAFTRTPQAGAPPFRQPPQAGAAISPPDVPEATSGRDAEIEPVFPASPARGFRRLFTGGLW